MTSIEALTDADLADIARRTDLTESVDYVCDESTVADVRRLLAEVDRLRTQLGITNKDNCPVCSWPSRRTSHMICMGCGTDYLEDPPRPITENALMVIRGYRDEVDRLRVELETKSVVHQCCEDLQDLRAQMASEEGADDFPTHH